MSDIVLCERKTLFGAGVKSRGITVSAEDKVIAPFRLIIGTARQDDQKRIRFTVLDDLLLRTGYAHFILGGLDGIIMVVGYPGKTGILQKRDRVTTLVPIALFRIGLSGTAGRCGRQRKAQSGEVLIIVPSGLLEIIIRIGIDLHMLFTGINLTNTGMIIESAFVVGAVGIGRCAFGRDADHTNRTRHDNRKKNRKGFSQHSFHQIILPFRKPSSDPSFAEQSSGSRDQRSFS